MDGTRVLQQRPRRRPRRFRPPTSTSRTSRARPTSTTTAFPVPAVGTRVTFHLSHLPADYDLVVYGPAADGAAPGFRRRRHRSTVRRCSDSGAELTHVTDTLPPQTLDDLRLQTLPIVGVSANRGSDPEDITVLSDGIRWLLHRAGDELQRRHERRPVHAPGDDPGAARTGVDTRAQRHRKHRGRRSAALPSGFNTLFLVNRQRLQSFYPGTGPATGAGLLDTLAGNQASFASLGFPNAVLSVDAYPAVHDAYAAWDAQARATPTSRTRSWRRSTPSSTLRCDRSPTEPGSSTSSSSAATASIPQGRLGDFTVSGERERLRRHLRPLERPLRHAARRADAFRRPVRHPRAGAVPQPAAPRAATVRRAASSRRRPRSSATLNRFGHFQRAPRSRDLARHRLRLHEGRRRRDQRLRSRAGFGAGTPRRVISDTWTRSSILLRRSCRRVAPHPRSPP